MATQCLPSCEDEDPALSDDSSLTALPPGLVCRRLPQTRKLADQHLVTLHGTVIAELILHLAPQTPSHTALQVSPGQPFRLDLLEILARAIGDPDIALISVLKEGVPTGAFSALPSSGLWTPAQRNIDTSSDLDLHRLEHCAGNWTAAENDPALLQQLVDQEVEAGHVALFAGTADDAAKH